LYHCEPEYEYYRGKLDPDADKSLKLIGERVRELREAKGLSISDLAIKAGMKRPNLSRLEHGRHQPSLETLERIAESLGISVARLVAKRFVKSTTGNSGGM
jgi:transcriptional regulator with XRE-family HTH domain